METTGAKVCIIHWNEPDKLKIFDKDIVCLTANNKVMTLKAKQVDRDWNWLCEKYNIKYWCFLSELIHD
jgi:hypothetical protein